MDLFAVTAPGLEHLAAGELAALGVAGVVEQGGVAWSGTREQLYAANLRLRTASRVLVRLAEFRAAAFYELERGARRVEWERYVAPGGGVRIRVTSRKSRLYHQRAVAERIVAAIERRVGPVQLGQDAEPGRPLDEEEAGAAARDQLFVVRLFRDRCLISADASGDLLHRRGYRQAVAKAPLRETLAAAMLLASGWDRRSPLVDPFCGSGTIPIEAALLARGIAPGLANPELAPRRYAFQSWPEFDEALWRGLVDAARDAVAPAAPGPIRGSDRDAGAIHAARGNAARAGVVDDVVFEAAPISAFHPPDPTGWVVTNPPHGVRIGERERLRDLYATIGKLARASSGWRFVLLSADRRLEGHAGLPFRELLRTRSGGLPVRVVLARGG